MYRDQPGLKVLMRRVPIIVRGVRDFACKRSCRSDVGFPFFVPAHEATRSDDTTCPGDGCVRLLRVLKKLRKLLDDCPQIGLRPSKLQPQVESLNLLRSPVADVAKYEPADSGHGADYTGHRTDVSEPSRIDSVVIAVRASSIPVCLRNCWVRSGRSRSRLGWSDRKTNVTR